jgi:signal transduction histidine kinase/DNA-binding response OmpR family regulator
MAKLRERVLLIEQDPDTSDLIARQTLQPLGFRVKAVESAGLALQEAVSFAPDVILVRLDLPGLSGKDFLAALSSQGVDVPVIVLAKMGMEGDVIQAFRLGATDYLRYPIREAEVVSAVERVLHQVRAKREREALAHQLHQANQELQRRVRELTTLLALGKAVASITNQRLLLDKIIEGAVFISEADTGWLLLREGRGKTYLLRAGRGMPASMKEKLNQPWDDGVSSLVALSGEALSIHGEPLKRFKISRFGQSALVVPVKIKQEVVGLLVVVRKTDAPFGSTIQALVEAVADYASISLVNAHLFDALEDRARTLQKAVDLAGVSEQINAGILCKMSQELLPALRDAKNDLHSLEARGGNLKDKQRSQVRASRKNLSRVLESLDALGAAPSGDSLWQSAAVFDLNEMARQVLNCYQRIAHQEGITLIAELASHPVRIKGHPSQIFRVFESLLSNAVKYNRPGGQVVLSVDVLQDGSTKTAHVAVKDSGIGIEQKSLVHIFQAGAKATAPNGPRFGGVGIDLSLARGIIAAHGGRIWAESDSGSGSTFRFTLPLKD